MLAQVLPASAVGGKYRLYLPAEFVASARLQPGTVQVIAGTLTVLTATQALTFTPHACCTLTVNLTSLLSRSTNRGVSTIRGTLPLGRELESFQKRAVQGNMQPRNPCPEQQVHCARRQPGEAPA